MDRHKGQKVADPHFSYDLGRGLNNAVLLGEGDEAYIPVQGTKPI